MPRIRTIKPEFWSHPELARQSDDVRLLALAVLNLADDEGFFYADAALVRAFAFPFTESSLSTHNALNRLSELGWIALKNTLAHGLVGVVVNFRKHQRINRPSPSKIKAYFLSESSVNDHGTVGAGTGNREQGKEVPPKPPKGGRRSRSQIDGAFPEGVRDVVNHLFPLWPKSQPKDGSPIRKDLAATAARVGEILRQEAKVTPELLIKAAEGYLSEDRSLFKAPQFFFGPGQGKETPVWAERVNLLLHQAQKPQEGQ